MLLANGMAEHFDGFGNGTYILPATSIEDTYLENLKYYHQILLRFGVPIVIILGVVGNALSLLVLCRQNYSNASTTWYMKTTAIFDFMNCSAVLGVKWTTTHYPHILIAMGDGFCKGFFFGANWMVTTSAWILVFMTIDRAISVCQPLKAGQICTVSRARKTVVVMTIVFALLASPSFTRNMKIPRGVINRAQCPFSPAWLFDVFHYSVVVVRLWAAPMIVLFCNIAIVTALFRRHQKRERLFQAIESRNRKESQLNTMLMLVSWVFILCYFPNAIDILVWNVGYPAPWTQREAAVRKITYEVVATMMYLNNAVNFYLYVLGVKRFRDDFINTFWCSKEFIPRWHN
jgi:hypothetical protein